MALVRLIPALLGILLFVAVAKGWLGNLDGGRVGSARPRPVPIRPDFDRWASRPVVVPLRPGEVFRVPHARLFYVEEVSVRGSAPGETADERPRASLEVRHPAGGSSELVVGAGAGFCDAAQCSARTVTGASIGAGAEIWFRVESLEKAEVRIAGKLYQMPELPTR